MSAVSVVETHAHHVLGGSPVLDIGGEVGALVVQLAPAAVPATEELEACPRDRPDARFHTGIHWRDINGRQVPVAVYPALVEGDYEILDSELQAIACARVTGGNVCELQMSAELTRRVSAG